MADLSRQWGCWGQWGRVRYGWVPLVAGDFSTVPTLVLLLHVVRAGERSNGSRLLDFFDNETSYFAQHAQAPTLLLCYLAPLRARFLIEPSYCQ